MRRHLDGGKEGASALLSAACSQDVSPGTGTHTNTRRSDRLVSAESLGIACN